jgi:hypothetical protein
MQVGPSPTKPTKPRGSSFLDRFNRTASVKTNEEKKTNRFMKMIRNVSQKSGKTAKAASHGADVHAAEIAVSSPANVTAAEVIVSSPVASVPPKVMRVDG